MIVSFFNSFFKEWRAVSGATGVGIARRVERYPPTSLATGNLDSVSVDDDEGL